MFPQGQGRENCSRFFRQCPFLKCLAATGNSRRRGQNCCAVGYPLRPANGTFINEGLTKEVENPYVIQSSPWHAPHALRREYATVLHAHNILPALADGSEYSYPGGSAGMVNAARDHMV